MATSEAPTPVRISQIAGRYLVFDADSASLLRRNENVNGTLTGTAPQQPTQNIFLGLPVELRPEEAEALVRRKVAYLVDDVAAHQSVLRNPNPDARKAYLDSLKTRKQTAQRVLAEKNARRVAEIAKRHGVSASRSKKPPPADDGDDVLFSNNLSDSSRREQHGTAKSLGVTPTCSGALISHETAQMFRTDVPSEGPLCRFLLSSSYYMTPGLRFGAKYSVYPGDPLRFHAHFMATQYDWDEEIPILDIVAGGRLATAVKKAFLMGGQQPGSETSPDGQVRTFSLEWAAM
ncbi:tRNA-splicing endonuclease subunit [Neonectria punicea]|uniref:tRNA-splicing endonuclease subunit Sen34 n=1 Tax=Neonectria punicea TaxID=979145 RepID=A0ABR1H8X2_9HYPO